MSKYTYTGQNNLVCPVCKKKMPEKTGPPVIYLVGENKIQEHRWCLSCFQSAHRLMALAHTEGSIELVVLPALNSLARRAIPLHEIPDDHVVKGFQFSFIPGQGLTLIMELRHEW